MPAPVDSCSTRLRSQGLEPVPQVVNKYNNMYVVWGFKGKNEACRQKYSNT